MIRYLQHDDIDKKKWDECIEKAFNGIIYAYSWYLDIVSPNWDALIENDYWRIMPLTHKTKFGISYLYPPPWTQQLGVFSKTDHVIFDVNNFLQAIPDKFKFIDIYLNLFNIATSNELSITRRTNYEIELNHSYQNIKQHYNKGTKYDISLAHRNQLQIDKQTDPQKIIELFRIETGKNIKNFSEYHYTLLLQLVQLLIKKKQIEIWAIYDKEGNVCAGSFFFQSHNRSIYIFSTANSTARKMGAIRYIIDSFIYQHCETNHILDFEGSDMPNIANLFQSFGARDCVYLWLKQNRLPKLIKWIKK